MNKLFLGILALLVASSFAVACGGGDDETVDIPGGGEVNVSDDLPDDFPDDFPQYDGADVQGSVTGAADGQEGTLVTFQTDDSLDDVQAFYEGEFEDGPWQLVSNSSSSAGGTFLVEKDDTAASVFLAEADGQTSILVTYGDKDTFGIDDSSDDDDASDDDDSSGDDREPTADDGSSSDDDGDSSGDDGDSTSADLPDEVELEDEYPADTIPVPDGGRVTNSSSVTSSGFNTVFAEVYADQTVEALKEYYEQTLEDAGYTQSLSSTADGDAFLSYTEGEDATGNNVLVTISDSGVEGYSIVSITVSSSGE